MNQKFEYTLPIRGNSMGINMKMCLISLIISKYKLKWWWDTCPSDWWKWVSDSTNCSPRSSRNEHVMLVGTVHVCVHPLLKIVWHYLVKSETHITWPDNFTLTYITWRNACIYVAKHIGKNVHSSTVQNSPKLGTAQMSINRWMDQLWYSPTL